jgi:guanyl-specific ribonuclease Sa
MPRWTRIALLLAVAFAALQWIGNRPAQVEPSAGVQHAVGLPPEAVATLEQIKGGGPFPYDRDGSVFQNRERRLPDRPRGYYREYTVPTPGSPDRGARRIVTGGEPPEVYYYTDDHYRSFRHLEIGR